MAEKIEMTCDECGKTFWDYASQKVGSHIYCSQDCARLGRRTKLTIECRWCGKSFELTPTEYSNGYRLCSWECRLAEKDDAKNRICEVCGKPFRVKYPSHPTATCSKPCQYEMRKRGKYRACEICGKQFWVMPVYFEIARFCNRACKDKGHSQDISGENHPNWNGGTSKLPYPFEWNDELKSAIRQRDVEQCMECGTTENLTVHHIDYDKTNCAHENLITLCNTCNPRANFNRKYWQARYTQMVAHL